MAEIDWEKLHAKCVASRVVYCGNVNSSIILELKAFSKLIRDSGMANDEIVDYCNSRVNQLELELKK